MLYTREFFELAKSRLNPGGVVTLFVQLYESNTEAVKSEVATFFEAFPEGDDLRQHLQRRRLRPGAARVRSTARRSISTRWKRASVRPEYATRCAKSLARSACTRPSICSRPMPGRPTTCKPWMQDAQINRDRNLRLQCTLAGRGLNLYHGRCDLRGNAALRRGPSRASSTGFDRI